MHFEFICRSCDQVAERMEKDLAFYWVRCVTCEREMMLRKSEVRQFTDGLRCLARTIKFTRLVLVGVGERPFALKVTFS